MGPAEVRPPILFVSPAVVTRAEFIPPSFYIKKGSTKVDGKSSASCIDKKRVKIVSLLC